VQKGALISPEWGVSVAFTPQPTSRIEDNKFSAKKDRKDQEKRKENVFCQMSLNHHWPQSHALLSLRREYYFNVMNFRPSSSRIYSG
jgi:hypothetical protein